MKILTLNINGYGEKHGKWQARKELIVDVIKKEAPDIVALQACKRDARYDDGIDQVSQLMNHLPSMPYAAFMPTGISNDGASEGNGFLSKIPLLRTTSQILPLSSKSDDKTIRVVMSGFFDAGRGKTIAIHNCHLSWVDSERVSNVTHALPYITAASSGIATLIVGDFNGTSDREELSHFQRAGFEDVWPMLKSEEEGYTFEADKPSIRIDYILASKEIKGSVEEVKVLAAPPSSQVRFSDHLGLMVTVGM